MARTSPIPHRRARRRHRERRCARCPAPSQTWPAVNAPCPAPSAWFLPGPGPIPGLVATMLL